MKKRVGDLFLFLPARMLHPPLSGGAFFLWAEEENGLQAFWERLGGGMDIFPSRWIIALERPFTWLMGALA